MTDRSFSSSAVRRLVLALLVAVSATSGVVSYVVSTTATSSNSPASTLRTADLLVDNTFTLSAVTAGTLGIFDGSKRLGSYAGTACTGSQVMSSLSTAGASGCVSISIPLATNQYNGFGVCGDFTFDGAATFTCDGTSVVPAANVYTFPRTFSMHNATINVGVNLKTAGYQFLGTGTLTNNGIVSDDGAAGGNAAGSKVNGSNGTGRGAGLYAATQSGCTATSNLISIPRGVTLAQAATATSGTSTGLGNPGAAGNGPTQGGGGGGGGGTGGACNAGLAAGALVTFGATYGDVDTYTAARGEVIGAAGALQVQFSGSCGELGAQGCGGAGITPGGGGGGGAPGGMVFVSFDTVGGTGVFRALGGNGGNGGNADGGQGIAGGGGGGGSAGGGYVYVVYKTATGSWTMSAAGGTVGNGGTGFSGGGNGGSGGQGQAGKTFRINLSGDGT